MSSILRSSGLQPLTRPIRDHLNRHSIRVAREQFAQLSETPRIDGRLDGLAEQLAGVSRDVGGLAADVELVLDSRRTTEDDTVNTLTRRLAELEAEVQELAATQRAINDRHRELIEMTQVHQRTLDVLFGPTGRGYTRFVTDAELTGLVAQLRFVGDDEKVVTSLHQAFRLLIDVENASAGRLLGSTPTNLVKLAAVPLFAPPSGDVIEIGAAFGLATIGIARQMARASLDFYLTLVETFDGGASAPADVSLTATTLGAIDINMALSGVAADRYRVVKHLDTAGDRTYAVVVITGGAWGETVADDLEWADRSVASDGIVIVEKVGNPATPAPAAALEQYVRRDDARLRLLGIAATCAILRAD